MLKTSIEVLKQSREQLKEISDALNSIIKEENERFEDVSLQEWESYRVQTEVAPLTDVESALRSVDFAIDEISNAFDENR